MKVTFVSAKALSVQFNLRHQWKSGNPGLIETNRTNVLTVWSRPRKRGGGTKGFNLHRINLIKIVLKANQGFFPVALQMLLY